MSQPINEDDPLNLGRETRHVANEVPHVAVSPPPLRSVAEHYQVALREEGEARTDLDKARLALSIAEEAHRNANEQLTLARNGLFKACGL